MTLPSTKVAKEICDALGLKNVRRLVLTFDCKSVATAEVLFYPEEDGVKDLHVQLKRYYLTEIPEHPHGEVVCQRCRLRVPAGTCPECGQVNK